MAYTSALEGLAGLLRENGSLAEGEPFPVVEAPLGEDVGFCAEEAALSIRRCGLRALPDSLSQLADLRQLDLTGNRLT
ncbi:MAG: hypothetical protein P8Z40_14790, partial [Chloroflexota bacterium]